MKAKKTSKHIPVKSVVIGGSLWTVAAYVFLAAVYPKTAEAVGCVPFP